MLYSLMKFIIFYLIFSLTLYAQLDRTVKGTAENDILYAANKIFTPDYLFEEKYKTNPSLLPTAKGAMVYGGDGNDTLYSGYGDDILVGGRGSDIYAFAGRFFGQDIIQDFNLRDDKIEFCYFDIPEALQGDKRRAAYQLKTFEFNNNVAGLAITRRDIPEKYDSEACQALPEKERARQRVCNENIQYYSSQVSEYEFIKEINPDLKNYMKSLITRYQKEKTLTPSEKRQRIIEANLKELNRAYRVIFNEQEKRRKYILRAFIQDIEQGAPHILCTETNFLWIFKVF